MARLPQGLDLTTERTVSDRTERIYGFEFPVADAGQVRVTVNGVELTTDRFSVLIRADGSGGSIDLLDRVRAPNPVDLAVGDAVTIFRDTAIAAPANLLAGAQELAERPVVSRADVEAIVRALVADWAEAGNAGSIPSGKLSNASVAALDPVPASIRQALDILSVDLVGGDLVGTSDGGHSMSVDLIPAVRAGVHDWAEFDNAAPLPAAKLVNAPGQTAAEVRALVVAGVHSWGQQGNADPLPASKLVNAPRGLDIYDEGTLLGNATTLDVRGVEIEAERIGATATLRLTVPPPGLRQAAVDARITALVESWALQGATQSIFADEGNVDMVPVGTRWAAQHTLPPITWHVTRVHDYTFPATVSGAVTGTTGLLGTSFTLDATDLNFRGAQYDSSARTMQVTLLQGAELARLDGYACDFVNAAGQVTRFLFDDVFRAEDVSGAMRLTWRAVPVGVLTVGNCEMRILEPVNAMNYLATPGADDEAGYVMTLNAQRQPHWAEATGSGPGGGLDQTQVDGRVRVVAPALIADWAEASNPDLVPDAKLWGLATDTQADAGTSTARRAWTPALVARAARAQIADWSEAGNTDPIPASKLTNAPSGGGVLDIAAVDARIADWAETDNTAPIPAIKLTNAPTAAQGTSEGPEWARTLVLTSSGTLTRGADLLPNAANQWTLATGRPSQVTAFNNGLQIEAARWDKTINGFWVAAFIGEEEQGAFQIGWGELLAPSTGATLRRNMALAVKETPAARRNIGQSDSKFITVEFTLFSNGLLIIKPKYLNALPDANTTLRVYPSVVAATPDAALDSAVGRRIVVGTAATLPAVASRTAGVLYFETA